MITVKYFVYNPFQVNTYLLFDETKECVIIDASCYESYENEDISQYIETEGLKPVKLFATHCHVDHITGNAYITEKYNIGLEVHKASILYLNSAISAGSVFGIHIDKVVEPTNFIDEGDEIKFGNSKLDILYTPGHAEGSICFYNKDQKFIIVGDVLFQGGIGRTDLPGGNYETLIESIKTKLFTLDDDYTVYSGHGPKTSIGIEKRTNPFF